MTADGEDHISPDKLNCLSKSSESQYIPSLRWSHVVFQLCATELLIGRGGKKKAPNLQGISIPWHQMTDAKRSFLSPTDRFSLPNKVDVVLELETHSLLPMGPMWVLSCLLSLVFTVKAYLSKTRISKFHTAYLPFCFGQ